MTAMAYQFDFTFVPDYAGMLAGGVAYTLGLTVVGGTLGVLIGIGGALSRVWKLRPFADLYRYYVELFRNTPFLVQLFLIFF